MTTRSSGGIYYGWFIVAACVFVSMVGMAPYSGFGVFVIPMSDEFGWSRGAVSLAASLGAIVGGLSQPAFGRVFDLVSGRILVSVGLLALAVSSAMLMFTSHIVYLVLVFGVFVSLASSAGTMNTAVALVSRWFDRGRATAIAIVAAGSSLGNMVFVPFTAFLIPLVGWRNSWLALGLAVGLAVPVAYIILRDDPSTDDVEPNSLTQGEHAAAELPPHTAGLLETDRWQSALRSAPFWQLCGGYMVCGITTSMISTHYVPYAVERGFSAEIAAMAFGLLSALNIFSALGAGFLGDRFGRKNVLACVYALRALAYIVLLTVPGLWGLFGFAIISGLSWFATVPLTISMTAEIYGLRNIGLLSGLVYLSHSVGSAAAVQFAGVMKDITGNYTLPFAMGVLTLIAASALTFSIREKRYSSRYAQLPAASG